MTQQSWNQQEYAANGRFVATMAGAVFEWLRPQAGERILDLGCGDGALTAKIQAAGAEVLGVDSSEQMLAAARAAGLNVQWANAEQLGFTAEFDAVFSNAVLHWVHDQDAMLGGVFAALKPGGRFVAEMGGHGNIAAISAALSAVLRARGLGRLLDAVNYYPSPDAYRSRLERHGFAVERIELAPRPTPLPATGMRGWLTTFRAGVLDQLAEPMREEVLQETVTVLEPILRDETGNWIADYVRLRFVARKP